jgi:hypothetical protein
MDNIKKHYIYLKSNIFKKFNIENHFFCYLFSLNNKFHKKFNINYNDVSFCNFLDTFIYYYYNYKCIIINFNDNNDYDNKLKYYILINHLHYFHLNVLNENNKLKLNNYINDLILKFELNIKSCDIYYLLYERIINYNINDIYLIIILLKEKIDYYLYHNNNIL